MLRSMIAAALAFAVMATVGTAAAAKPIHAAQVASATTFCGDRYCPVQAQIDQTPKLRKAAPAGVRFSFSGFGSLGSRARAYLGNTARDLGLPGSLWCADFMNKITGGGTHSRLAKSYARYGSPAAYGCTDCIAVLNRRGGGHVGVITGYDAHGNPIIVSGNHGGRVDEGVYPRGRITAYRFAT